MTRSNLNHAPAVSRRDTAVLLAIILLSILLVAPTLDRGLVLDDYFHRALLAGQPIHPSDPQTSPADLPTASLELFNFLDGQHNDNLAMLRERGTLPWWVAEDLKIRFFRPVAAITHWFDYQLWPTQPWLMHLHSIVWYALLVALWGLFLLKLGARGWPFALMLLLYGLHLSNASAVGWLANRNGVLAALFAVVTLWFYHLSVIEAVPRRAGVLLSAALLAFILALYSAEGGVSAGALIGAYLLCLDRRPLLQRWLWMVPFVVALVLVRIGYQQAGFGAANSGAYFDPIKESSVYLANLLVHAPYLVFDHLTGAPTNTLFLSPDALVSRSYGVAVVVGLILLTWLPLLLRDAQARFFLVASLIALIPLGATVYISGRLMLVAGLGLTAVQGLYMIGLFTRAPWVPRNTFYRVWAWFLMILMIASNLASKGYFGYAMLAPENEADHQPRPSDLISVYDGRASTLVLLNPSSVFEQVFYPARADQTGQPVPRYLRALAPGVGGVIVRRIDAQRLQLESQSASFAISPKAHNPVDEPVSRYHWTQRIDWFFAGADYQLAAGTSLALPDMTVTVLAVNPQGLPTLLEFTFAEELESASYQWVCWDYQAQGYGTCSVPAVGQRLVLPGPAPK